MGKKKRKNPLENCKKKFQHIRSPLIPWIFRTFSRTNCWRKVAWKNVWLKTRHSMFAAEDALDHSLWSLCSSVQSVIVFPHPDRITGIEHTAAQPLFGNDHHSGQGNLGQRDDRHRRRSDTLSQHHHQPQQGLTIIQTMNQSNSNLNSMRRPLDDYYCSCFESPSAKIRAPERRTLCLNGWMDGFPSSSSSSTPTANGDYKTPPKTLEWQMLAIGWTPRLSHLLMLHCLSRRTVGFCRSFLAWSIGSFQFKVNSGHSFPPTWSPSSSMSESCGLFMFVSGNRNNSLAFHQPKPWFLVVGPGQSACMASRLVSWPVTGVSNLIAFFNGLMVEDKHAGCGSLGGWWCLRACMQDSVIH